MNNYNLYYKGLRINRTPLSENDLNVILSNKSMTIKKVINDNIESIPINKVRIVKCTIV